MSFKHLMALLGVVFLLAPNLVHSAGRLPPVKNRPLEMLTYVAFDVETTGLSPQKERIVELAMIRFTLNGIQEKKSWLLQPGKPIPPYVSRIHGIDDEMVKDAPTFEDIYPEIKKMIRGAVFVAHNASFDVQFLSAELQRLGKPFPRNYVIDNLNFYKHWYPDLESYQLSKIATAFGIEQEGYHRAMKDTEVLRTLFVEAVMQKKLNEMELKSVLRETSQKRIRFKKNKHLKHEL